MRTDCLVRLRQGEKLSRRELLFLTIQLSIPGILAQITTVVMQYIDASMVGHLGANQSAAIGLVSSSTWLLGCLCSAVSVGFTVQIAHAVGAGDEKKARGLVRQGLVIALGVSLLVLSLGVAVHGGLPRWLGGEEAILANATAYFRIYCMSIPFILIRQLSTGMMQSTGDMKTPSMLSALVCLLDVVLNMLLIFPTRTVHIADLAVTLPSAGLGVVGAALGTALSEVIISLAALYLVSTRNKRISLRNKGSWRWRKHTMANAARIAIPLSFDQIFMCSAYVAGTKIVAGLGTVAVAANSLAITAESLCYMPGYGIGAAATAIIGQTIGAGRSDLTKSFSRVSVYLGMILMGFTAVLMYLGAPFVFSMLTSSVEVAALGTEVLRLELIAEPLYGASICCAGVFRGAGDTLRPSVMNLVSMWCVRIMLALVLVPRMGLHGYWTAMALELCFRGLIFLIRLYRGKWMKKAIV